METMFVQNFGGTNKEYCGIFESGLLYFFKPGFNEAPFFVSGPDGVCCLVFLFFRLNLTQRMMKIGVEKHM